MSRSWTRWAPWLCATLLACGGSAPPAASPAQPAGSAAVLRPGEAPAAPQPVESPWEKIRESDGIVIHRREVPGSPLIAFKGEGLIEQPILRVATVLLDASRSHEWADRVVEARELGVLSDHEVVHYSHVATTFITKDRDFVTRITLDVVPGKLIRLRLRSIDDPRAPKTDFVRGELIDSSFTLTAESDGVTRIGLYRAVGATAGDIGLWVLTLAFAVGTLGGLLGVLFARLAAVAVDGLATNYLPDSQVAVGHRVEDRLSDRGLNISHTGLRGGSSYLGSLTY